MKINKVIIDNFRNIKHVEYDLNDMNIFAGPNGTGKSNTLLAIYWLMNDYLLDGSSDDTSNKPFDRDQKIKTSVELVFEDGWNIKKEYFENWVKKQGTKEIVMEGNVTQYYIRGDKVKIKEARNELAERLNLNIEKTTSDFNLSLALSDPNYIGSQVDSKVLRSFVIDLVGDVKNEDVFNKNPLYETVRALICEYDNDPSLVIKSLKKKIATCKDDIKSKNGAVESLSDVQDISSEELQEANDHIFEIDENIALYRDQKINSVNKNIEKLEKELADNKLKLSESTISDSEHLNKVNADVNSSIELKRKEHDVKKTELATINNSMFHADHQKRLTENGLEKLKGELSEKKPKLDRLREEYANIKNSEYINNIVLPEETKCPECGYLLNSDVLESIRENIRQNKIKFTIEKDKKLEDNINAGKQLNLDVQNLELKITELEKDLVDHFENFKKYDDELGREGKILKSIDSDITELTSQLISEYESETTKRHKADVSILIQKLEMEKQSNNTLKEIDEKILLESEKKLPYKEIISKHDVYQQTQKEIARIESESDKLATVQTEHEQRLATVSDFMKTKLNMLSDNVETVFGTRVSFTLVKANIKEGSWEEVCYPSVIDKETPFIRGSESERIRTGIYMIECIKKRLNIPDIPIIFDRSNDLDSTNLKGLETKAQIITTRVDDVNFKEVTLVHE